MFVHPYLSANPYYIITHCIALNEKSTSSGKLCTCYISIYNKTISLLIFQMVMLVYLLLLINIRETT